MGETGTVSLLYLIDALPYVFRAYFALPERLSARGHPVHAVYGFATFLIQLLRQEPLTHVRSTCVLRKPVTPNRVVATVEKCLRESGVEPP